MEQNTNERIERYVYQVNRLLPRKNRDDIERELRTLISDMIEERCGGKEPKQKDIDIILIELGDPRELAAQYTDLNRYLIGPALFPRYWMLLKLVLLCVIGGMAVVSVIVAVIDAVGAESLFSVNGFAALLSGWIANWIATTFSVAFSAFTVITIIFALIENRDKVKLGEPLKKGLETMEKEFTKTDSSSFLDSLPTIPEKSARISRGGTIAGIVFTIFFMLLFAVVPQFMSVHLLQSNGEYFSIPLFNADVLKLWTPLLLFAVGLGLVREIIKMLEGRYTKRLALVTVLCDVPAMLLTIFIFTRDNFFNTHFLYDFTSYNPQLADDLSGIGFIFHNFGYFFLVAVVFAFILDMVTTVIKGFKYD